jgi:hypothetical protein
MTVQPEANPAGSGPGLAAAPGLRRATASLLALLAVLGLAIAAHRSQSSLLGFYGYGFDTWFFVYSGQSLIRGKVPYLELWDNKPPLIGLINALGLKLGGGSVLGVYALDLGCYLATVCVGFRLLRQAFGPGPAFFGSCCWVLASAYMLDGCDTPGLYGLLPGFLAWWCYWRLLVTGRSTLYAFLVGIDAGLLMLLKPNLVGTPLVIAGLIAWEGLPSLRIGMVVKAAIGMLGGVALVVAPALIRIAQQGAFPAFLDQVFHFPSAHVVSTIAGKITTLRYGEEMLQRSDMVIVTIVGWACGAMGLWKGRFDGPRAGLLRLAIVALPVEMVLSSLSGRTFSHYFLPWMPGVSVLSALVAYGILHASLDLSGIAPRPDERPPASGPSRAFVLGVLLFAIAGSPLFYIAKSWIRPQGKLLPGAVAYVERETAPDTPVFSWGGVLAVNCQSGRPHPGKFATQEPFFVKGYATPAMVDELIESIVKTRPLIIDAHAYSSGVIPSLERADRSGAIPPAYEGFGNWAPNPELERFYRVVEESYRPVARSDEEGWVIYEHVSRLKDDARDATAAGGLGGTLGGPKGRIPMIGD